MERDIPHKNKVNPLFQIPTQCPFCNRNDLKGKAGLRSHIQLAHTDQYTNWYAPQVKKDESPAENKKLEASMAEQPCIACQLKDLKIKQLEDEKTKTEASAADALMEFAEAEKKEVPGLFDYIRHAEGADGICSDPDCPVTKQWKEAKAAIVKKTIDDLTPDQIEEKAVALGLMDKRFKITR
jgi:hypothetical protein